LNNLLQNRKPDHGLQVIFYSQIARTCFTYPIKSADSLDDLLIEFIARALHFQKEIDSNSNPAISDYESVLSEVLRITHEFPSWNVNHLSNLLVVSSEIPQKHSMNAFKMLKFYTHMKTRLHPSFIKVISLNPTNNLAAFEKVHELMEITVETQTRFWPIYRSIYFDKIATPNPLAKSFDKKIVEEEPPTLRSQE
jgi:hypothetical protein